MLSSSAYPIRALPIVQGILTLELSWSLSCIFYALYNGYDAAPFSGIKTRLKHIHTHCITHNTYTHTHTHTTYSHTYTHTTRWLRVESLLGVLSEIDKLKRMWPFAWKTSLNAQPRWQTSSTSPHPYIIKGHGYYDNTENTSNDRRLPNWLRRAGSWNWKFFIVIMSMRRRRGGRERGRQSGSSFGFIAEPPWATLCECECVCVCPQKALVISASRLHLRSLSCGTSHLSFCCPLPLPSPSLCFFPLLLLFLVCVTKF